MSKRSYNGIANALLLIGIASAVFFDSGILPPPLIGSMGIIAGIAAVALYFWNQRKSIPAEIPEQTKDEVVKEHIVPSSFVGGSVSRTTKTMTSHDVDAISFGNIARHDIVVRDLQRGWMAYEMKHFRKEVARGFLKHYAAEQARRLQWDMV